MSDVAMSEGNTTAPADTLSVEVGKAAAEATAPPASSSSTIPGLRSNDDCRICIRNIGKWISKEELLKLLKKKDISDVKSATKLKQDPFAFVTFESKEARDVALPLIKNIEFKNRWLDANIAQPKKRPMIDAANDKGGRNKKAKHGGAAIPPNGEPQTIMDVTTPLWRMDYDKQLAKKEQDMRRVHLKIARVVRKEIFKQKKNDAKIINRKKGGKKAQQSSAAADTVQMLPEWVSTRGFLVAMNRSGKLWVSSLGGAQEAVHAQNGPAPEKAKINDFSNTWVELVLSSSNAESAWEYLSMTSWSAQLHCLRRRRSADDGKPEVQLCVADGLSTGNSYSTRKDGKCEAVLKGHFQFSDPKLRAPSVGAGEDGWTVVMSCPFDANLAILTSHKGHLLASAVTGGVYLAQLDPLRPQFKEWVSYPSHDFLKPSEVQGKAAQQNRAKEAAAKEAAEKAVDILPPPQDVAMDGSSSKAELAAAAETTPPVEAERFTLREVLSHNGMLLAVGAREGDDTQLLLQYDDQGGSAETCHWAVSGSMERTKVNGLPSKTTLGAIHLSVCFDAKMHAITTSGDVAVALPSKTPEWHYFDKEAPMAAALPFEWKDLVQCISHNELICPQHHIVPSPIQTGYRNKCEFSIGYDKDGQATVGFRMGSYMNGSITIASVEDCVHVPDSHKEICKHLIDFLRSSPFKVYNRDGHDGVWRTVTVRSGTTTGQNMVTVVACTRDFVASETTETAKECREKTTPHAAATAPEWRAEVVRLKEWMESKGPLVTSMFIQEYNGVSTPHPDEAVEHLFGESHIIEKLLGFDFRVSTGSFFQVNTQAAELLYSVVRDELKKPLLAQKQNEASSLSNATVYDICCGTGTIAICVAPVVGDVVGVELCKAATDDADINAALNDVKNVKFVNAKAEDVMENLLKSVKSGSSNAPGSPAPAYMAIVDPPRAGLHYKCVKALRSCVALKRIVYVSCNPTESLVEDTLRLCGPTTNTFKGPAFRPVASTPVDLFPQTPHCEMVMVFERD
jgi:tRNA/tmRNA/rRNA uracil-C5-methylase (TrmA/RlmC/RlmD family)